MPKASPGLRSFNAGLLSPQMGARSDFDPKYQHGCSVLDNFVVLVEGPVVKRPGFSRIAPQKYDDKKARMQRHVLSNDQAYALELGEYYMRVHRNQATVLKSSSTSVSTIIAANPIVVSAIGHGMSDGDHVWMEGTEIEELNDQFHRVTSSTINTFEIAIDGSSLTSQFVVQGTVTGVYEVVTPYTEAEVSKLKMVSDEDILYAVTKTKAPRKFSRIADDNWTLGLVFDPTTFEDPDGNQLWIWPPFNDLASDLLDDTTITPTGATAAAGDVITLTASAAMFSASDVGRHIKIQGAALLWGYGEITTYTSTTQVSLTVKSEIDATLLGAATTLWAWGAFDEVSGYPGAIALGGSRLFFGGTPAFPQHFWFSVSDAQENMRPYGSDGSGGFTVLATSAGSRRLSGDGQNAIEWLYDQGVIYCGTRGREWTIQGTQFGDPITPSDVDAKARSSIGSRVDVSPLGVDNFVLFAQRAGRKVKELAYREDSNGSDSIAGYGTRDMTRLSREVLLGRLKYWGYQQEPHRLIWCVMEDGTVATFTYESQDDVYAWATHTIGGLDSGLESVAIIPRESGDEDEVWATVRRTVGGVVRRSVEVMTSYWTRGDDISGAVFMDSATIFETVRITASTITGVYTVNFGAAHNLTTGDFIEVYSDPTYPESEGSIFLVNVVTATQIEIQNEDGSEFTGDVSLSASGTVFRQAVTAISGLLHLAGETIGVVVRGQVSDDIVVDSLGRFTLPSPAGECIYGLRYDSRLQTMKIEGGSATGTSQGRTGRIHSIVLRLDQTGQGLYVGGNFTDMDLVDLWSSTGLMDNAIPLFDGDTERIDMPDETEQNIQIALKHALPLPCSIVGAFPIFNVQDE